MKEQLALLCTGPGAPGCPGGIEVSLDEPLDRDLLTGLLREKSWFLSVLTPPGQGKDVPVLFGPICEPCAKSVMPELVTAAKQAMEIVWGPDAKAMLDELPPEEREKFKADIEARFRDGPPKDSRQVARVERGTRVCPECKGTLRVEGEVSPQGNIRRQNILICEGCDESFTEILDGGEN